MADEFLAEAIFKAIDELIREDEALRNKTKGTYHFVITKGPKGASKEWVVDTARGEVSSPPEGKSDCKLTLTDADFQKLVGGELTAQKAFMMGKLKISGNMMLAQKFSAITSKLKSKGVGPAKL